MNYELQNHKNETPKNAGQILRQLLIDAGINVDQYNQLSHSNKENNKSYRVRRKKQRYTNQINYREEIIFSNHKYLQINLNKFFELPSS